MRYCPILFCFPLREDDFVDKEEDQHQNVTVEHRGSDVIDKVRHQQARNRRSHAVDEVNETGDQTECQHQAICCSQNVVSPTYSKKRGECFTHSTALFLVHHQWARQEFSPVRLSACKASILLRKTARTVVRRARRTLFAPRFRSRSIVAPAHKPAAIFSDQSPRAECEP